MFGATEMATPSKYVWALRQHVSLRLEGEVVITEVIPPPDGKRYGAMPAAAARVIRIDIVNRKSTTVYINNVPVDVGEDFWRWCELYDYTVEGITEIKMI